MEKPVTWNSQPLDEWRVKYAKGKLINLDGHSAHYVEKGDGKPVILLHGWFHDSQMWSKNVDSLAQTLKVYALDLWGFGYSTREPMDYGYPLYATQLLKFMDTLNIQKVSLVGQSMGSCPQPAHRCDRLPALQSESSIFAPHTDSLHLVGGGGYDIALHLQH